MPTKEPPPLCSLPGSLRGNCTRKFKLYTHTFCLEASPMSKDGLFLLPALKLSKTDVLKNSQLTLSIFLTLGHVAGIWFAGNSKEHFSMEGPRCPLVPHPGEHHVLRHPKYRGQLLSLILVTVYANKECPSTLKQSMPLATPCRSCLPESEHAQMQLPSTSWRAGCQ